MGVVSFPPGSADGSTAEVGDAVVLALVEAVVVAAEGEADVFVFQEEFAEGFSSANGAAFELG